MQEPKQLSFVLTTRDGYEVTNTFGLGKYLFGGAPQSDVVLPDLSQERLFGIVQEIKAKKLHISIMAFDEGVRVNGKIIPANKFVPVTAPFTVHYDWLKVRFGEGKSLSERMPLPKMMLAASVALAALSFIISMFGTTAPTKIQVAHNVPAFTAPVQEPTPLTPNQQAALLAEDLKRRLLNNDLSDKLHVEAQGEKIIVSGTVNQNQSYRWRDLLVAAKKNYNNVPIISEMQLARGTSDLAQQVAAIALTPSKYIIGKDGVRYAMGDMLPDGWRIENIGSFGLVLSKDGFEETVKF